MDETIAWLLTADEPWSRYRTLVDLLELPETDPQVQAARQKMLAHPQVQALLAVAGEWGQRPLKRHNDASHPLYALGTLADFGLRATDPGMQELVERILAHQSAEGAFQTTVFIPRAFGGPDKAIWTWVACDAPTLLYALLSFGLGEEPCVKRAVAHLVSQVHENGFHCAAAPELGRFRGPGRRNDPCPIANVYALKALSLLPETQTGSAAQSAAEIVLSHWQARKQVKYFLFGMGSDFNKLKYPFVWYDLLHVVEVLSRFSFTHTDARFGEMLAALAVKADGCGRYTASSMYKSWKGWSFADKKAPSAWLTYCVRRIQQRAIKGSWLPTAGIS